MEFISNFIRPFKRNKKRSFTLNFDESDFFYNKPLQLMAYHSINRSKGEPFNFNPNEKTAQMLIHEILIEMFDKNQLDAFEEKRLYIEFLLRKRSEATGKEKKQLEENITDLRNELTESKQLKEKLSFTFKGFDISAQPIPRELLYLSHEVSENDCLALLRPGYINAQINAIFNISQEQFNKLSVKGKNRNRLEEANYIKILDFSDAVFDFLNSIHSNPSNVNNEKLKNIISLGKEGKKMYAMLVHLLDDIPYRI